MSKYRIACGCTCRDVMPAVGIAPRDRQIVLDNVLELMSFAVFSFNYVLLRWRRCWVVDIMYT